MPKKAQVPKVSIIVPVYNSEKFIERCLNSIFNQTYSNIEVICVNDGSKDKSSSILKEYQKLHSELIVLHQENKGAAAARNLGLKKATGDYMTFVDSDDAIKKDYIECLVDAIASNDAVFSGHERRDGDNILGIGRPIRDSSWAPYKFSQTCGKMYRRSFLIKHRLSFPLGYDFNEDVFFTMLVLAHTSKIKIIDYVGYIAYRNAKSLSNTKHIGSTTSTAMLKWFNDLENATSFNKNISTDHRLFFYLKTVVTELYQQRQYVDIESNYQQHQAYFAWLKEIYVKYGCRMRLQFQKDETIAVNMLCNLFIFSTKTHTVKILLELLKRTSL